MNYRDAVYFRGLEGIGDDAQRERLAILNKPPAPNPKELLEATVCKVLRPFYIRGECVNPDQVVTLERHDALSLQALQKVKIEK